MIAFTMCFIASLINFCAKNDSLHETSIFKMLRVVANDFVMTTQRNVQLRFISTNLMLCENEIQNLKISFKIA